MNFDPGITESSKYLQPTQYYKTFLPYVVSIRLNGLKIQ